MPLRRKVRISRWREPSSPSARRTALIRVVSADSETIRPSQTACSRSSLLTTRLRVLHKVAQQVNAAVLCIDIDERKLLMVNALHPVDGGVIEDVRVGTPFGQGLEMIAGVAEGAIDHAGDEGHLAERLPVHRFGRGHISISADHAMTGSGASSARRRGDWK